MPQWYVGNSEPLPVDLHKVARTSLFPFSLVQGSLNCGSASKYLWKWEQVKAQLLITHIPLNIRPVVILSAAANTIAHYFEIQV